MNSAKEKTMLTCYLFNRTIIFKFTSCSNIFKITNGAQNISNPTLLLGTAEFLQSHPEFIDSNEQEIQVDCNKDTGGRRTLHCWSRGIFSLSVRVDTLTNGSPFTGIF